MLIKKIETIISQGDNFGYSNEFNGKKANVEFVSANPTGPLNSLDMDAMLYWVIHLLIYWKQLVILLIENITLTMLADKCVFLGASVAARYLELLGINKEFSEEFYQGEYIKEIAQKNL